MKKVIELQRKLLPDLLSIIQKRFHILQYIGAVEPVGRRNLATNLGLTERVLRSEVDFLKQQKLLYSTSAGMNLTIDGKELLQDLSFVMREIAGIDQKEHELEKILNVKKVLVVPGDSDEFPWVKMELSKACVKCINESLKGENIIAVTGGSTMSSIADMMTPRSKNMNCYLCQHVEELEKIFKIRPIRFAPKWQNERAPNIAYYMFRTR